MIKLFTPNDVIRYVYNELTTEEKQEIETAMLFDEQLCEEVSEMSDARNSLKKLAMEPSERSVQNILDYSKSFYLHTV